MGTDPAPENVAPRTVAHAKGASSLVLRQMLPHLTKVRIKPAPELPAVERPRLVAVEEENPVDLARSGHRATNGGGGPRLHLRHHDRATPTRTLPL